MLEWFIKLVQLPAGVFRGCPVERTNKQGVVIFQINFHPLYFALYVTHKYFTGSEAAFNRHHDTTSGAVPILPEAPVPNRQKFRCWNWAIYFRLSK